MQPHSFKHKLKSFRIFYNLSTVFTGCTTINILKFNHSKGELKKKKKRTSGFQLHVLGAWKFALHSNNK